MPTKHTHPKKVVIQVHSKSTNPKRATVATLSKAIQKALTASALRRVTNGWLASRMTKFVGTVTTSSKS